MAILNSWMDKEIKRKAESGIALDNPTKEKMDRYKLHQDRVNELIKGKALSGQRLDTPNEYKNKMYFQYQQEPIMDMFNQQKSMLDNMFNQQKQSQLSQLKAQRDRAVGQINQQKAEAKPVFQQKRNQADVVSQQNVQKLRELMAANGLSATGENVSANVAANNERLNSLNGLNMQEQQVMNDFDRRISDINNPAEEQAIISAIESQRSQALADAFNQAQQIGYQRFRDTVGDNRYNQEWNYQQGRDQVADNRYNQEWKYQKDTDAKDRAWREYTFKNMSAAQKEQFKQSAQQFGEDKAWQMFALQYQGELDKSMNQAQLDFYNNQGFPTP